MVPDSVAMGFYFMLTEWSRRHQREEQLSLAMRCSVTLRLPEPISGGLGARVATGFEAYIERKYHKIISLVDFMASTGAVGAEAIVEACEVFAMGSQRQWLKVAGEAKAEIIDECLHARPSLEHGVIAEFGAFVGYSCARMAWRCSFGSRVLSLESDAIHVCVARHVLTEARCSQVAEVISGMAHDSVRRLPEDWGLRSAAFMFMDHRGTRFHVEWASLEQLGAAAPGAKLLADNTLKPGAPVLLWHCQHCHREHSSASWSVPEFVSHACEDWMTITGEQPRRPL